MIANSQLFYNVFQIRNKKQENTCHENFSYVYFILIRVYDILDYSDINKRVLYRKSPTQHNKE